MNQLSGKYVNVVLSVECGRGMDFLRNNVYITANFNGRVLESDHIPPEENPPFNTELVWEIEKKELRKIRSANYPLRVECITIDSQNRKERIGFALLSLRSAHIIPESKANEALAPAWFKLIGCQADKRKSHPELYLSLSLRDHLFNEQLDIENNNKNGTMPFILEEDTQNLEDSSRGMDFAVKYFENGHIQIGDENIAKDPFVFNLLVKDVVNLDALLPEALVFQTNSGSYFLTFKILGIIIKTKPFQKQMHTNISLNERIVVNLLSKRDILEEFFHTQTISISFYYGYDKLGVTKLNCDNVWEKVEEQHFFKFPSPNGIVPFGCTEKSPYITLESWIDENPELKKKEKEEPPIVEEIQEKPKTRSIYSNVCKKNTNIEPVNTTINIEEPEVESQSEIQITPFVTKSVDTVIVNEPLTTRPSEVMDVYEKFVVVVSLKYLIWLSSPPDTKIMFKFLHPRCGSCTTIFTEISNAVHQEIILNNLYVRIGYISTMDKINKLLRYWNPKLVLADENEAFISDQRPLNVNCMETQSKDYQVECKHVKSGLPLAKIGVNVTIKVTECKLEEDYETLYLLPIILDEIITVKEISDLMKWKNEEKERFEKELEDIKLEETDRLEKEYEEKKMELDEKVARVVKRCKDVQDDLMSKLANLKIEKQINRMAKIQDSYDEIYQHNLNLYSTENTKEIIELLSRTQRDNELLKKLVDEHKDKLLNIEKSSVTKIQTTNLLEELKVLEKQFNEAQNAKCFFQQQFQNTLLVTHPISKNGENEAIGVQNSKLKGSQISLDKFPHFYTEHVHQIEKDNIINNVSEMN